MSTNNELILSTANAPAKFTFKNAKLNEISAKIAAEAVNMNSVYNAAKEGAEAVNRALAPLFGELLTSKCYVDDGFKSVADYAEQTFGMGKSMAYMLARVGKEYHNEGGELTAKAVDTLSTSKLAELTGVDRVAVAKAIESGELTADSSLADCRDFAARHKKPGKEKIVPTFDIYAMPRKDGDKPIISCVMKDDFLFDVVGYIGKLDAVGEFQTVGVKLDGDKASAAQHFILYGVSGGMSGFSQVFEYRPHVAAKKPKKSSGEKFDLAAYIAGLSTEEREALAAMVAAK